MSSSVLYGRLRELTGAGLVAKDAGGAYRLTELGASLSSALMPLIAWARHWAETWTG